ncbi:MAG: aspartoacylase [Cyanosarcina radialis HA8281-LM2]|nr:aspartoacylase [Cyanosarcina radialis HA8281-LM2]
MLNTIKNVAIVGGTHGNEFTGVYLVKKFDRLPHLIQRSSLEVSTLFANPKAFEVNRRYIDRDLNRCFLRQDLENPTFSSYEDRQAKIINQKLGKKGAPKVDFIIDLHSTTANMKLTIILTTSHPFNLGLGAYLSCINPLVKICLLRSGVDSHVLSSICELGCVIEVGAIAQGVLNATLFQQTEALIQSILDYLEAHNQGRPLPVPSELTCYRYLEAIDYPRNEQGELQGMIHPHLQFKDYEPLNPGDPMFLTFDGEAIAYEGKSTVYPIFINEAAYYEKGIAMCLTERVTVQT